MLPAQYYAFEAKWQSYSTGRSGKAKPGATRRSISDADAAPTDITGPYFLRYSLPDGTRPWEPVGNNLDDAIAAREHKQAYFEALKANVPVLQGLTEPARTRIADAASGWLSELQAFRGKDQQGISDKTIRAYNCRLGFFLEFAAQLKLCYMDQIDRNELLRYVKPRDKSRSGNRSILGET